MGRKQKLRRSKRLSVKGDYHRIIDASEPFPVSPDRKRKYDKEEGEEALIEELIHVSESYKSDEDADYVPDDDEDEESESSEEDDDEDEDDDDDDEDEDDGADEEEEQGEDGTKTLVKPTTTVQAESKTEARGTVHVTQGKTDSQIKMSVKQKPATQGISPGKTVTKQELSAKPEAKVQAILQDKADSKETSKMDQNRVEEKKDAGRHAKPNASSADTDPKKNKAPIEDAKNKRTLDGGLLGVIKAFNNKM